MEDYFDIHFDMNKYPSDFNSEDGKVEREKLSKFFSLFIEFYNEAVVVTGYHPVNFKLNQPHHMLFGTYENTFYFSISNHAAIKGRTGLYKINNNTG